MNSLTSRKHEEEQKQADIRRQIAELQAQLKNSGTKVAEDQALEAPSTPKKRKRDEKQRTLAPATPSPKKRKKPEHDDPKRPSLPSSSSATSRARPSHPSLAYKAPTPVVTKPGAASKPAASSVLSKLASYSSASQADQASSSVTRSSGFAQAAPEAGGSTDMGGYASKRGEDLALIEDLTPGPYEHKPPFDDPHFQQFEPNSGIRLSERTVPHEDFQDYLRGRYYLSPSTLYSVIRLLPNKQGYDVPVEGDWVTIAVVAERGPLRYSRAPVGVGKEDLVELPDKDDGIDSLNLDAPPNPSKPTIQRWKGKAKEELFKPSGKKYMNLKLVDFGCRSKSSATAGKSVIRGDALLSLLLFECDRVEEVKRDGGKVEKIYKGGSRGAFERLAKLREGTVVALLNPKILKPFQRAGEAPHPRDNMLAITPESIDSIAVIGHALDLGMCAVLKRDGKACGGWCDKRVSEVCDWHIQHAVQQKRAGRAEFTSSTSGMTSTAKRKSAYDPSRQWGLKPEPDSGTGATYIVSGHIVSGGKEKNSLFVNENIGREAQAKAARKLSGKDADRALETLLKRDKEGMRAVKAARDHQRKLLKKEKEERAEAGGKKNAKGAKAAPAKRKKQEESDSESESGTSDEDKPEKAVKNAFSATMVRSLGFDPTAKDGRKVKDSDVQRKLEALASLQSSRKEIALGPRPGKLKSTVRAPDRPEPAASNDHGDEPSGRDSPLHFPSDDEHDPPPDRDSSEAMIDLDSSDIE